MGGMVTVFDPQGNRGEIPEANLAAAVKAGAMPGVAVKAPDGTIGHVPANRYRDAAAAGAKVLPFEQQDVKHPGFWQTLAEDFGSAMHAVAPIPAAAVDLASGASLKDVAGNLLRSAAPAIRTAETAVSMPAQDAARKAAGRSLPYRVGAPIAEAAGANVPGMESSADSGDIEGVAAHTVAAEAPYLGTLAAPAVAPFADRMASRLSVPPESFAGRVARTAGKTAVDLATDVPMVRQLSKVKGNWEATAPKPTFPGAPLGPEAPAPEVLQANALSRGPKPVVDPAAGLGNIPLRDIAAPDANVLRQRLRENAAPQSALDRLRNQPIPPEQPDYVPERPSLDRITGEVAQPASVAAPPAEELAPKTPTVAAPSAAAPKKFAPLTDLEKQINDALGGKPLQKGVSLRNQGKANALPQGFTPVESSALKGFKYDPAAQEFTAVTNNGQQYTHGEVTPDEAQAFTDADSQGKAWNTIRQNHVLVKQNGLPVKPATSTRSIVTDPETGRPEFSDVLDAKKNAAQSSVKKPAAKASPSADDDDDLTSILQQSLAKARQKGTQ